MSRRFFETEGIAILTMLVSRYKIEVKEEPEFAGETFDERKTRILQAKRGITTTCVSIFFFEAHVNILLFIPQAGPHATGLQEAIG